jgi:DNA-binding GntR family transcriptional regulator
MHRDDFATSLPAAFANHREIIEAIADREGDRAAKAMKHHLEHVAFPRSLRENGTATATRAAS